MGNTTELAEKICEFGRRIYQNGYVAANDGNISARCDDGSVLTTPTGVSKGFMTPDMLVRVALDGTVLSESGYKPSSESKMHLAVYIQNPDVNAVVHTHAPSATMLSILHEPITVPLLTEAVILLGNVPVVDFALPGSDALGENVAPLAREYNAALLANHGAVTWGKNIEKAYFTMETLEYYAKIVLYSKLFLGKGMGLNREQVDGLVQMRTQMGLLKGGYPTVEESEEKGHERN